MTNAQVFRWFCKEQGITHLLHRMYHKIQPSKITYEGGFKQTYLTFDQYINDIVGSQGFSYMLDRIVNAYLFKIRVGMRFEDYDTIANNIRIKFKPYNRKWEYFVKNNIKIDNGIKINEVVSFNDWGNLYKIKVSVFYPSSAEIYGHLITDDNNNGRGYSVRFNKLLDENGMPKTIQYQIRRNRKVYHGTNSR